MFMIFMMTTMMMTMSICWQGLQRLLAKVLSPTAYSLMPVPLALQT